MKMKEERREVLRRIRAILSEIENVYFQRIGNKQPDTVILANQSERGSDGISDEKAANLDLCADCRHPQAYHFHESGFCWADVYATLCGCHYFRPNRIPNEG